MKKLIILIFAAIFILILVRPNEDSEFADEEAQNQEEVADEFQVEQSYAIATEDLQTEEPANSVSQSANGTCGEAISWTLNSDGTLTLSGSGEIPDYEKGAGNQPWIGYWKSITTLVIEDGITRIGDRAFQSCAYIERAIVGNDVLSIGEWAFQNCYALTSVEVQPGVNLETGAFRSTPVEWEIGAIGATLYNGSSYDSALSQVIRTGDYREDMIQIAFSQVGYHEGDSEADLAGGNVYGTGDYTEYGRRLGSVGTAWCSEFASWCIRMAGVPTEAVASSYAANATAFTKNSSAVWYTWDATAYANGGYLPRKGDLLLWAWDENMHSEDENLSHTSILLEMYSQDDGSVLIKTIDGNSNHQVKECTYQVNSADGSLIGGTGTLCYIIAPDYEGIK